MRRANLSYNIVTIQPTNARFDPPAPLTLPNVDAHLPGAQIEMFSYDHDLEEFVAIGLGTVNSSGTLIESNPGVGVIKAGWHGGSPPRDEGCATGPTQCGNVCYRRSGSGCSAGCVPDDLNEPPGFPCWICRGGSPVDAELVKISRPIIEEEILGFRPNDDLWQTNYSFLSTSTISADAEFGSSDWENVQWDVFSWEGGIRNVVPENQIGLYLAFTPDIYIQPWRGWRPGVPRDEQYAVGTGGSESRSRNLAYLLSASYIGECLSSDDVTIAQDTRDVIRQEYLNHVDYAVAFGKSLPIPNRNEF